MEETFASKHKTVRLAALLFFTVGFPAGAWGLEYVSKKIFVAGDAVTTANNILAHEFLFRTGIFTPILSNIAFVVMVLMLYRVFGPVNKRLSRFMLIPVVALVPITMGLEFFKITALLIVKGGGLMSLPVDNKQEVAYLLLRMHGQGIVTSHFLGGIYWLILGILVYRSRLAPAIIGILFIIPGIGYIADTSSFILLYREDYVVVRPFIRYTFLFGLLSLLWFLIKGVREPSHRITASESIV